VGPDSVTFIATGGPLPPDTYTVTLRSAANGFTDLASGELLDGDGDGTPGGDFVDTFIVDALQPVVVSLPDFTRGSLQPVDVPPVEVIETPVDDVTPGLPIQVSNADGIESVVLTITYDPELLDITAASPGPDMPVGSTVVPDFADVGTLRQVTLTFSSPDSLSAGSAELITLTAEVPDSAPSGTAQVLDVEIVSINGGAPAATADDALHEVGYFGDTTGNGGYSGLDAQRVARVVVGLDAGFEAFPTIDPLIVSDVTGNGGLSGLDAQRIAQMVVGLDPAEIPPLPQPLRLDGPPSVAKAADSLTPSQLLPVVEAAVARIESINREEGLPLPVVVFEIIDLPGDLLGLTDGQIVQIDINAAGHGWFIDATPWDDVEFALTNGAHELRALPGLAVADRADLLTVILHELGHVLGYDHEDDGIMDDTLPLGTRRLLLDEFDGVLDADGVSAGAVDQAFASFGS
jgi:hypothetical protein